MTQSTAASRPVPTLIHIILHLADDSATDAIHEGRFQEVLGAAKSFVAYGANYG